MCALEHASEHPIAKAIVAGASAEPPAVEDFQNLEGLGVQGVIDGHAVLVGRERLLAGWSVHLDEKLATAKKEAEQKGRTAVLVAWDGKARGVLVVADTVKPTPEEAIEGRPGATPAASGDQCGHSTGQQAGRRHFA
jgi:P-type Cu+ transporter